MHKFKKGSSKKVDSQGPPPVSKISPKPEPDAEKYASTDQKSSSISPASSKHSSQCRTPSLQSPKQEEMPEDINPPSSASKGSESQGPEFGILDGTQAAYLYGVFDDYEEGSQSFSAIGIEIALRYLRKKGIKAKAMLHEGREKDEKSKPVIDRLKKKNLIEFIPKDKYYEKLFSYGVGNKCYIFSTAREEIEKHAKDESAEEFLEEHLIPFAFFRNDFRLNPNPSRIGSSVFRGRTKPISDKKPNEKSIVPKSSNAN